MKNDECVKKVLIIFLQRSSAMAVVMREANNLSDLIHVETAISKTLSWNHMGKDCYRNVIWIMKHKRQTFDIWILFSFSIYVLVTFFLSASISDRIFWTIFDDKRFFFSVPFLFFSFLSFLSLVLFLFSSYIFFSD